MTTSTNSKVRSTDVSFGTEMFEFSHSAKPRGRGCWAFEPRGNDDERNVFWHNGTFADAKRAAAAHFAAAGVRQVTVLP